jgi:hypothetical protein
VKRLRPGEPSTLRYSQLAPVAVVSFPIPFSTSSGSMAPHIETRRFFAAEVALPMKSAGSKNPLVLGEIDTLCSDSLTVVDSL